MKKAIAISFLIFFSINYSGHYIIFYIQKWHIQNRVREEILAGVPDRFLEVVVDNEAVKWEEPGREFSRNGEMYDVVRSKTINGQILLYCLNDSREEGLLKDFARLIRSAGDSKKGKSAKHQFKVQLDGPPVSPIDHTASLPYTTKPSFTYYEAALVSHCKEIIIPPPWNFLS